MHLLQSVSEKIYIPSVNETNNVTGVFTFDDETIKISWNSSKQNENSLVFHFKNNTKSYALDNIELSITAEDLPKIQPSIFFVSFF